MLHLALLAWPVAGNGIGGETHGAVNGARLTATLAGPRALTSEAARRSGEPAKAIQRSGANRESPTPSTRPAHAAAPTAASAAAAPPSAPTVAPALPATTHYYPADQLTARPRALDEPLLDPQPLAAFVASGEIALTLWIDERGKVADLSVERSDLPDVFAQTAAAAFRELRFVPGEIDGRPVGTVLRIAVRYDDERLASDGEVARESGVEPAT